MAIATWCKSFPRLVQENMIMSRRFVIQFWSHIWESHVSITMSDVKQRKIFHSVLFFRFMHYWRWFVLVSYLFMWKRHLWINSDLVKLTCLVGTKSYSKQILILQIISGFLWPSLVYGQKSENKCFIKCSNFLKYVFHASWIELPYEV